MTGIAVLPASHVQIRIIHDAGKDLTPEMPDAPHFDDLLLCFDTIGIREG